jgi:hypothetical protein
MDSKLITQKEVALKLRVTENTVKNWRNRNLLSFFKAPGSSRILYYETEIDQFIENHTKEKGGNTKHKTSQIKGKPWISSKDDDWRIS